MLFFDFFSALLLGFFGGLHCAGMCGGILASLSLGGRRVWWPGIFAYQFSRVFTYVLLGLITGFVGSLFLKTGLFNLGQKALSAFAGVFMILLGLQVGGWLPESFGFLTRIAGISPKVLKGAMKGNSLGPWFLLGVLNGLLPCGLVYAGLAMSLEKGNPYYGALTMLFFGVGTVPWLLGVAWAMKNITPSIRGNLVKGSAVFIIALGLFLIFKGAAHMNHGAMEM